MIARSPFALAAIALFAAFAGCGEPLRPSFVTGTYTLAEVNGAAVPVQGVNQPVAGAITLTATGNATRRISYTIDALGTVREFVDTGTYQLVGTHLRLALQQGSAVWTPSGMLDSSRIILTYPNPADGTIVELYRQH